MKRLIGALGSVLLLAGCAATLTVDPNHQGAFLTSGDPDAFTIGTVGDQTLVRASATNTGENSRIVFWPTGQARSVEPQVCGTFTDGDPTFDQEGVALHITSSNGVTRAVTVTKNMMYGVIWAFNVHVWDSTQDPAFTRIGSAVLSRMYFQSYPWRLCARVRGTTLTWKVWPTYLPEPAWGNPDWGGTAAIPVGWQKAGNTGWFAGHLKAGETVTFTGLVDTKGAS